MFSIILRESFTVKPPIVQPSLNFPYPIHCPQSEVQNCSHSVQKTFLMIRTQHIITLKEDQTKQNKQTKTNEVQFKRNSTLIKAAISH